MASQKVLIKTAKKAAKNLLRAAGRKITKAKSVSAPVRKRAAKVVKKATREAIKNVAARTPAIKKTVRRMIPKVAGQAGEALTTVKDVSQQAVKVLKKRAFGS
jgi:hypothetical protein